MRLGELFELINTRLGERTEEPPVLSVTKHDGIVMAEGYFDRRVASAKLDTYKMVAPDDWAYSTIHIDEGSIARNHTGVLGVVSPMYTTMRFVGYGLASDGYCELLLRSPWMLAKYSDFQQGSVNRRKSLPWGVFTSIPVQLPPLAQQRRIVDLIGAVDGALESATPHTAFDLFGQVLESWMQQPGRPLSEAVTLRRDGESVDPEGYYRILGILRSGEGFIDRGEIKGSETSYPTLYRVRPNQLVYRKLTAWEGPISVSTDAEDGGWVSNEFPVFDIDADVLLPDLLRHMCRWPGLWHLIGQRLVGSVQRRKRLNPDALLGIELPMPDLDAQQTICGVLDELWAAHEARIETVNRLRDLRSNLLTVLLSGEHEIPETYDELMESVA